MRSRFYIIPEQTFTRAFTDMAITNPASAKMLYLAMNQPTPKTFSCRQCGRSIWWQDCPTGGWWVHDIHFPDDHEAECGGIRYDDDD